MRNAKEIFIKQAKDMFKNIGVLVQFIIFPVVALIMTRLVAMPNYDIPNDMFVTMMAAIFAGMGLVSSTAGVIAEDIENKSLRLLVMAGVKPQQYLLGVGGFILLAAAVTSVAFGVIGGFASAEMLKFLAIMVTGAAASIILGATIGIFAKNQQAATGIALPIAMILGFTPM
ncbi:MAG: ABC transporter permease, partial [Firmicutes bacterium]|nr:ABC transporter permease [Bacillota bacterium]